MLMRFLGGGIGHRGAAAHRESIYEDQDDSPEHNEDTDPVLTSTEVRPITPPLDTEAGDTLPAPPVTHYDDGEEDYGYEVSDIDEDGEADNCSGEDDENGEGELANEAIDELGAEDGEENEEMGIPDGYAPL